MAKKSNEKPEYYFGYKTDDNRFGDTDLATPFIWKKKWEKDLPNLKGEKLREHVTEKLKERQSKLKNEIAEVKKLRDQRQMEKNAMEKMREDIQRQIERENFGLLNEKEEKFHKEQVREGAIVRIKNCRENAFDNLFKTAFFANVPLERIANVLGVADEHKKISAELKKEIDEDSKSAIEKSKTKVESILHLKNPYVVLSDGSKESVENLEQINVEVEKMIDLGEQLMFWENVAVLLQFFKSKEENFVKKEIFQLLSNKDFSQLDLLEKEVIKKLSVADEDSRQSRKHAIDFEFWEELLPFIKVFKAKENLNKFYQLAVVKKMEINEKYGFTTNNPLFAKLKTLVSRDKTLDEVHYSIVEPTIISYEEFGRLTVDRRALVFSVEEFEIELKKQRKKALIEQCEKKRSFRMLNKEKISISESLLKSESSKPLAENEHVFAAKNISKVKEYWWQDKFRPRKPLFFNTIKTGYEWSRYNRSHYDHENPPPKIVQGYKFNIFYPDLIDIKTTPTFHVESIPGDDDFVILRFRAGAPYEDIAFKIINKDWDMDKRAGYRSTFSNGVLKLFFNFTRFRYRR